MRIASALIAVLGLTAVFRPSFCNDYYNQTFNNEANSFRSGRKSLEFDPCCPSQKEMVEPENGKSQNGMLLTLYRDKDYRQRFYEISCKEGVAGKPCKFVNKKLESRCVQKFSYTYALVKNQAQRNQNQPTFPLQDANYILDYIEVRSGCSCEVKSRKKKRNREKKLRNNAMNTKGGVLKDFS